MDQITEPTLYRYTAPSGIPVISCKAPRPDDDFPTALHYCIWSWRKWGKKILRAVRG